VMRRLKALPLVVCGLLVSGGGCSLAVDSADIDARCPDGTKYCDNRCVELNDPRYGCKPYLCTACELPNTIPKCELDACAPRTCLKGFGCADCATNILIDHDNCGTCGNHCGIDQVCIDGHCSAPE